ncbi:MAG: flagellar filament capping protein FliD, partial [Planctomycetota bacterium]
GGVDADSVRGDNLQTRYIAEATRLDDINYGRGVAEGSFRILDGNGNSVVINIGSDSETVYDVIEEINALASANSVKISARINDTGDGILIENTITPVPTGIISVVAANGTTASDLGILGQAETDGGPIDGSYEKAISVFASDTVDEIVAAINEAGIPVNATVLNTQAAVNPVHVQISSEVAGRRGEIIVDAGGFDLGISTLTEARDSKVFFGSDDPAKGTLIQRTSNTLDDVIPGVTLDLISPSSNPVTVSISRDTGTILDSVSRFVTTFNDAVGRIDQYDFFDVETEERGPLLGDPTTSAIRSALFRTIQRSAQGLDTQYTFLHQVGIRIGANGQLTFDQDGFLEAYNSDPEAVEALFAAFKASSTATEEIAPGVTILSTEQTFTQLGFGDLFDQLLDGLTNSIDGVVTLADQGFDDQIDLINDRIEDFDERLEAKRTRLERQFLAMETALAQLQSQNNALISLSSNVFLAQNLLGGGQ